MQKGKKVRHLKTSVTINPNRMLLSVCSLTTGEIISEGAVLTLNLDKGPSIYYNSKGMGGSRKWPVLLILSLHLYLLGGWESPKLFELHGIPIKLLTATNFDNVATLSSKLSKLQVQLNIVVCYIFEIPCYFCNANFGNYAFTHCLLRTLCFN